MRRLWIVAVVLFFMTALALPDKVLCAQQMTEKKAENSLRLLMPGLKVLSVAPSPLDGVWEVVVQNQGRMGIVYIDSEGRIAVFGAMVDIERRINLTDLKINKLNLVDSSSIPLDDSIVLGSRKAAHKVVVFDDPD